MQVESLEVSCCVQTHSNVLFKSAVTLIDVLWKNPLACAGVKAQLIPLYLVPYCTECQADLQSGWIKRKEASSCNLSVSLPPHTVFYLSTHAHRCKHVRPVRDLSEITHSLELLNKALQCCSIVCPGHSHHVGWLFTYTKLYVHVYSNSIHRLDRNMAAQRLFFFVLPHKYILLDNLYQHFSAFQLHKVWNKNSIHTV